MKKSVDILSRQTVAGLGGTAMKTCLAYIKNALNKPEVCCEKGGGGGCNLAYWLYNAWLYKAVK